MITIVTGNGYSSQLMSKGCKELGLEFDGIFKDLVVLSSDQAIDLVSNQVNKQVILLFPESMMAERKYFKIVDELLDVAESKNIVVFTYSANFIETVEDMANLKQVSELVDYLFIDLIDDEVDRYSNKDKGGTHGFWVSINNEFDEWDDKLDYIKSMILYRDIDKEEVDYRKEVDYIESEVYAEKVENIRNIMD